MASWLRATLLGATFGVGHGGDLRMVMTSPFCDGTESTCGWAGGKIMDIGTQMMIEYINGGGVDLGGRRLIIDLLDDGCDGTIAVPLVMPFVVQVLEGEANPPFALIGSACSGATMAVNRVVRIPEWPHISHAATSMALSEREAFPTMFRLAPVDGPMVKNFYWLAWSLGWKKHAMWYEPEFGSGLVDFATTTREGYVDGNGNQNNIDLISRTSQYKKMREQSLSAARDTLQEVQNSKARVVIMLGYEQYLRWFVCAMKEKKVRGLTIFHLGWFSESWWLPADKEITPVNGATPWPIASCTKETQDEYSNYAILALAPSYNQPSVQAECLGGLTVQNFEDEFTRRYALRAAELKGLPGKGMMPFAVDAVCMMVKLFMSLLNDYSEAQLYHMDPLVYAEFNKRAQEMAFEGVSGPVSFPADGTVYGGGDRISPFYVKQKIPRPNVPLAEPGEDAEGMNGVYDLLGSATDTSLAGANGVTMAWLQGKEFKFDLGFTVAAPAPELFPSCADGSVYDYELGECQDCPGGTQFLPETSSCVCKAGFSAKEATGDDPCGECKPGEFSATIGNLVCESCAAGTFSEVMGATGCTRCAVGSYIDEAGASGCVDCDEDKTTLVQGAVLPEECVCKAQSYMPCEPGTSCEINVKNNSCLPCGIGLVCEAGSMETNIPTAELVESGFKSGPHPEILPKYYSLQDEAMSVYLCRDLLTCPGGLPESCAKGRDGLACGACKLGYYEAGGAECTECTDLHGSRLLFPILPVCVGIPFCLVFAWRSQDDKDKWTSPANAYSATLFVWLSYVQTIASMTTASIPYPSGLAATWGWMPMSLDMIGLLRVDCAMFFDYSANFYGKLLAPLYCALVVICAYAIAFALRKSVGKDLPVGEMTVTGVCIYGSIYNTFFIAVAQQAMALFQCYSHPNNQSSLLGAPNVLCYEGVWGELVAVAILGILIFIVGWLALYVVIILMVPKHFDNKSFRLRWKFIYMRYRPKVYWWSVVLLLKGFWISMTAVVPSTGGEQALWLGAGLVSYLVASCTILPWRSRTVLPLDVIAHFVLVYVVCAGAIFVDPTLESLDDIGIVFAVLSMSPFGVFSSAVAFMIFQRYQQMVSKASADSILFVNYDYICESFWQAGGQREPLRALLGDASLSWVDREALLKAAKVIREQPDFWATRLPPPTTGATKAEAPAVEAVVAAAAMPEVVQVAVVEAAPQEQAAEKEAKPIEIMEFI